MRGRRITAREGIRLGGSSPRSCRTASWTLQLRGGSVTSLLARRSADSAQTHPNSTYETPLHAGLELEGQTFEKLRPGPEFKHGVQAFLEKRKPDFTAF